MKKISHILFLSCLKATVLIEKKLDVKLSPKEKIQLRMHKMMCDACTRYDQQQAFIDSGILKYQASLLDQIDVAQLKRDILKKIEHPSA